MNNDKKTFSKLYRADFLDRNGNYIGKTIKSIDIGISPSKIINEDKLLINLKYIFPNKNYDQIKKELKRKIFFLKKKFEENYEKLMQLGDKSIEPRDNLIRIYPQKNLFSTIGQIDNEIMAYQV